MMFARMNGGGEKAIEPGFKVMKENINPNVLVYEPSPGKMTELFQSGQAVLAVWGTGRVQGDVVLDLRRATTHVAGGASDEAKDTEAYRTAERAKSRGTREFKMRQPPQALGGS